tara:strand:- start:2324 stop:2437 length:114 start_codon:yes stop_codon:yes gene_type:complete
MRFEKQLVIDISGMNEWYIQEIEKKLSEMKLTVRREE